MIPEGARPEAKKILIVDDSRTIRQQVEFTLTKGGFVVIEAENGKDGIEKLRANPDTAVVVSDVNMPEMGGLDMLEAINADPTMPHPPIIMLTTEGSTNLVDRAKKAGAKGWLVKPFKPEQLVAAVTKLAG